MKLRDYQIQISTEATQILNTYRVALLLMQMRTGKTITALNTAKLSHARKVLFITKKKVIENIYDDARKINALFERLTVTNYEQVSKMQPDFDFVIIDEFHALGAFPKATARTKAIKKVIGMAKVLMLSGTPTPESYSQMYHPLWCVDFWPEKNFYLWAKNYVKVKERYFFNRKINDYSDANGEKVRQAIKHISLHYTQEEAGFMEVVKDQIDIVPMPEVVKKSLAILERDKIIKTKDGRVVLADTQVKLMSKTHQICSGTVKAEDDSVICFDDFKARYIKEKYAGKKIAIYYKYIGELEHLKKHFTNVAATDQDFNNTGNEVVYLSQIQSGREGINLSAADYLIMYNIDYSALSYLQVRERLNAKNRDKEAVIVWVFTDGGIEKDIYKAVLNKQDYTLSHFKKKQGSF